MIESRPPVGPSLLYSAKRLELVIRARLDDALRGSGVTTLQYTALTVLATHDGMTAAQLARDSFVTPQSMSDMVRALDQRGLVRRAANPESRRELLVHLTDAGRDLLDQHAERARAIETTLTAGLRPAEVDALRHALTTGWTNLRDDDPGRRTP